MRHSKEKDELLINYLSGSATEQERKEALTYIRQSPENRKHFEELKKYYQLSLFAMSSSEFNKEEGWARIRMSYYKQLYQQEKLKNKQQIKILVRQFALPVAASLIIAFLIGALLQNNIFFTIQTANAYNEVIAPFGAKSMITLPDDTKIWLNAGSKLRYASNFSENNREVYLEGEAYFDVTKSEKNIFVVNTGDIRVNVYGTQFNVKAYADESEIITTLVSGSVSIDLLNQKTLKEPLVLKPNQSATFLRTVPTAPVDSEHKNETSDSNASDQERISKITIESAEPKIISSWKDSVWVIRGEELGKLAVKLERRFNVQIAFDDESLKYYKFSGSLTEETFEQVMKIIKISAPITFSVENNYVKIKEDKHFKERYDSQLQRN
jgi:transmembrane sensor